MPAAISGVPLLVAAAVPVKIVLIVPDKL